MMCDGSLCRLEHTHLGDESGDEGWRGDVERRIEDGDADGCRRLTADMGHFFCVPLLDFNRVVCRQIKRRVWCRDIERDAIMLGEDGELQRPDLIGDMTRSA